MPTPRAPTRMEKRLISMPEASTAQEKPHDEGVLHGRGDRGGDPREVDLGEDALVEHEADGAGERQGDAERHPERRDVAQRDVEPTHLQPEPEYGARRVDHGTRDAELDGGPRGPERHAGDPQQGGGAPLEQGAVPATTAGAAGAAGEQRRQRALQHRLHPTSTTARVALLSVACVRRSPGWCSDDVGDDGHREQRERREGAPRIARPRRRRARSAPSRRAAARSRSRPARRR